MASSGETPAGGSRRAAARARSRACGSARSCIQPCSSHSRMAPASCSTEIAQMRSVRTVGLRSFVIGIEIVPWTGRIVRSAFRSGCYHRAGIRNWQFGTNSVERRPCRVADHPVAHFRRRDLAGLEQCELLQAILGRLPSLHAADGNGILDALGSGFTVQSDPLPSWFWDTAAALLAAFARRRGVLDGTIRFAASREIAFALCRKFGYEHQ
jgi:hypothetical protein